MRDKCLGKSCGNFGDKGCKGGNYPPWNHAKWYIEELPKITEKVYSEKEIVNIQGNLMQMKGKENESK